MYMNEDQEEGNENATTNEEKEVCDINCFPDARIDSDDLAALTHYEDEYLKPLAECLEAGRISSNEYAKEKYNVNFYKFWREDTEYSNESDIEAENEDCDEN
ncbi:uncharacterized protein MONOS_17246 [Monocercomonoides exilis]|uniref:uncharacterized protein n=1 Tax=Monocercomonoides exilis TaxID=2049356 RepID=UPI00355A44BE|nr:hypothetical protein MONOS_17246 [Monocercomonoides exilis]